MKWPWQRVAGPDDPDGTDSKDVEVLLAEANAATPAPAGPFQLVVEDVFSITGRGTVVTGKVSSGTVRTGQQVEVVRGGVTVATTTVTGVEAFRKVLESASVGDFVGLLLAGVAKSDVLAGDVISA